MSIAELPAQNLEAERSLIGSMWFNPAVCDDVALILKPEDFYSDANEKLYRRTMELHNDGKRPDATLLHEKLNSLGELGAVGGIAYMVEVADCTAHAANAIHYAKIVRDKATLRRLRIACQETLHQVALETDDASQVLGEAEQRIFDVREVRGGDFANPIGDVLLEAMSGIDNDDPALQRGLTSGFGKLDGLTNGFRAGQLTILAGRPGNGKSALAGNIAEHLALHEHKAVLFVSLEMTKLELAERMLCANSCVNSFKLRNGTLTTSDKQRLMQAYGRLAKAPITIDDCPNRTMTEIAAVARRLKRQGKLDLLMIDYLQLVTPDNRKDPRQEQVASMSRRLKNMTKELDVPILCLAQLNRQAETGGEPQLWHLRESGAIEQDADNVMFIWRCGEEGTEAVLKVAKQRNGPTGKIPLIYIAEHVSFKSRVDAEVEKAAHQFETGLDEEF